MSIVRVPYPNALPTVTGDYAAQNDLIYAAFLYMQHPVPVVAGNIVKGAMFNIGGTVYQATGDTAITGTPSAYVKITPAGASASAAYVASLAGVSWNDTYAGYYDGSGNLYVFDEALAIRSGSIAAPYRVQAVVRDEKGKTAGDFQIISADRTLVANGAYKASGNLNLTLPQSPNPGDRVEVYSEDWVRILQSDAQHVMSLRGRWQTTKGISSSQTGYLQLPPKSKISLVYQGSGLSRLEQWTKLSNPPAAASVGLGAIAFRRDGLYFALGTNTTPFIDIYKRSGDTFSKIAAITAAAGQVGCLSWSKDGMYLAANIGSGTTTTVEVWKWTPGTDTFTKLGALPATGSNVNGLAWSPSTNFLSVGQNSSPFVMVFKRTNDTFAAVAALPAALQTLTVIDWFPDESGFVGCGNNTSPNAYRRMEDTFALQTIPAFPTATGRGVSICPVDDRMTLFGMNNAPHAAVYFRNGDSWSLSAAAVNDPSASGSWNAKFTPNGEFAILHSVGTTPFFTVYKRTGHSLRKCAAQTALDAAPTQGLQGYSCDVSGDSMYAAFQVNVSPWVNVYKTMEAVTKAWLVESLHGPIEPEYDYLFK